MARHKGGVSGWFASLKMQRMVAFESLVERDYIYLLDFDHQVSTYQEQPFPIYYQEAGKKRHYTPDFYFIRQDHSYLVECKHHKHVEDAVNRPKWEAARHWCRENGATFYVVTDAYLRTGYRLENIKLLTDHARHTIDVNLKARLLCLMLGSNPPATIAELMTALSPQQPQTAITPILHWVYHQELFIPLDESPISVQSPVSLASQSEVSCLYSVLIPR